MVLKRKKFELGAKNNFGAVAGLTYGRFWRISLAVPNHPSESSDEAIIRVAENMSDGSPQGGPEVQLLLIALEELRQSHIEIACVSQLSRGIQVHIVAKI